MLHGLSRRLLAVAAGLFAAGLGTAATATAGSVGSALAPAVSNTTSSTASNTTSSTTSNTAADSVHLLSPRDGSVLTAGTTATLDWMPLARLALEKRWEEWEAFLSVDGGVTYPVRITPHLDRDVRRLSFKVPSLPTRFARILLRVGDERREQEYELPQRFSITAAPEASGTASAMPPRQTWHRGEPARHGERGVLAWVEGSRRGGQLREVVAEEPAGAGPGVSLPASSQDLSAVAAAAPPSGAPGDEPEIRSIAQSLRAVSTVRIQTPRLGGTEILLLLTRQNE